MQALNFIRSALLWIGSAIGALCIVVFALALIFGIKPHVVISGSMEPDMPVGSLVLARAEPAVQVKVGDIVTVPQPNGAGLVTHRVVDTTTDENGQILLTLKGDANQTNDPFPYPVATVGAHVATVPGLGYVAGFFRTPFGFAAIALVALVIVAAVLIRPRSQDPSETPAEDVDEQPLPATRVIDFGAALGASTGAEPITGATAKHERVATR